MRRHAFNGKGLLPRTRGGQVLRRDLDDRLRDAGDADLDPRPVLGAAGLTHVHRQTPRPFLPGRSERCLLHRSAVLVGDPQPRDGLMPPGLCALAVLLIRRRAFDSNGGPPRQPWRFVDAPGRGTWDFAPGVRTRHEIPSVGTSERDDSNEQLTFLRYLLCAVKDSPTDGHDREISDLPTSRVRA
jgi:hypothetical protein